MKTVEEVEKLFSDVSLLAYQVETKGSLKNGCQLMLAGKDIPDLITFAKRRNIDTVFYHFIYFDPDQMCIDDDVLDTLKMKSELIESFQPTIEKYNAEIEELDFSKPAGLIVYCIYQGVFIYIQEDDDWLSALGYDDAHIAAMKLFTKDADRIVEQVKKLAEKRQERRDECHQIIIDDPKFHICTNATMRRNYANVFFNKNSNRKYYDAFYSEEHGYYDISTMGFIEEIWREFKGSLSNKL